MWKTLPCIFLALGVLAVRAQVPPKTPLSSDTTFDVIVGISQRGETKTVKTVQKFFSQNPSGIVYRGYCNSQRCFIFQANQSHFYSRDSVVYFLRNQFGQAILGFKDYTVGEFYRSCDFRNEQEYKYFKTTYR